MLVKPLGPCLAPPRRHVAHLIYTTCKYFFETEILWLIESEQNLGQQAFD